MNQNDLEKFILLGDIHFGKSKGNPEFLENQLTFFENQLIPFMLGNNIKKILQLGDFLDNRKNLDGIVYKRLTSFFKLLQDNKIEIIFPIGNHDIYLRESLEIRLVDIFKDLYPDVLTVVSEETSFEFNGKKVQFIPWLVEGAEVSKEAKKADVILGHFEFKHFEIVRGIESKHGLEMEAFGGARVYTGHYHNVQRKGNILYCGTPYQFDWSDFKEPKGFWVTNFHEDDVFFENKMSLKHIKIIYDDTDELKDPIEIHGLSNDIEYYSLEDFFSKTGDYQRHRIKFIINRSNSGNHMNCIQHLKALDSQVDIINNFQVSQIIKTDYADSFKSHLEEGFHKIHLDETNKIIQRACQENDIEYVLNDVISTLKMG